MAYSTELSIGFSKRQISIDENRLIFHETTIPTSDITGFSNGITQHKVNGINTNKEYLIQIWGKDLKPLKLHFFGNVLKGKDIRDKYDMLVHYLWEYAGNRILNDMYKVLLAGKSFDVDKITVAPQGLFFTRKPLFGKATEYLIKWNEMTYDFFQGNVTFRSNTERKARKTLNLQNTKNAMILVNLADTFGNKPELLQNIYQANNISY